MGVVKKSHPCGFIIERLFYNEQIYPLLIPSLKITSGEISAKEQQGRVGTEQINSNGQHGQETVNGSQRIKINSIASKVFFKKQNQKKRIIQFRPSIHQPNHHPPPHHTHPEERIWAGRTPPAEAPGPGRSEEWHTKSHENICE